MIQTIFKRYEKKYLLSPMQYSFLKKHLDQILQVDTYGLHTICSIYFDTDEWGTAAGFYAPLRERMDAFRHRMLTETEVFDRMTRRLDAAGFVVTGEAYRRPLKGDLPSCCQPYYNRKRFSVTRAHPIDDLVFSDRLLPTIVEELDTLAPLVQFVNGREIAPFSALAKGARHE